MNNMESKTTLSSSLYSNGISSTIFTNMIHPDQRTLVTDIRKAGTKGITRKEQ